MGDHGTAIEWTHAEGYKGETWNPTVGCHKVSEGCRHCYAEQVHKMRLDGKHGYPPFRPWGKRNAEHNVTLLPDRLDQPLRRTKPRRVFVNSMSDLFHELIPDDYIARVFTVMAACPQHVFQVLTKRPDRARDVLRGMAWDVLDGVRGDATVYRPSYGIPAEPLPNVWMGTSIELDKYASRADDLRATPAVVRFISAEPLLGPLPGLDLTGIHQVIAGGESGSGHRPLDLRWVRDLRDACAASGTAFFVKQLGGHRPGTALADLPEDLRIRQYPNEVARV